MDWYAWAVAFVLATFFISVACVYIFGAQPSDISDCREGCLISPVMAPSYADQNCFLECIKALNKGEKLLSR